MGAGGAQAYPAIAMVASQLIGSLMAPEGQELQTFEGEGALDPKQMLGESKIRIEDMIRQLGERANRPVSLPSAYVQQPPVFTGGGLPMPIGVSGMDPALANPKLLRIPGLSGWDGEGNGPPGSDDPGFPGGGVDESPTPGYPGEGTKEPVPEARVLSPRRRMTSSTAMPDAGAPNVSEHDDLLQGRGAVELLLRSYMSPSPQRTTGPSRAATPFSL